MSRQLMEAPHLEAYEVATPFGEDFMVATGGLHKVLQGDLNTYCQAEGPGGRTIEVLDDEEGFRQSVINNSAAHERSIPFGSEHMVGMAESDTPVLGTGFTVTGTYCVDFGKSHVDDYGTQDQDPDE